MTNIYFGRIFHSFIRIHSFEHLNIFFSSAGTQRASGSQVQTIKMFIFPVSTIIFSSYSSESSTKMFDYIFVFFFFFLIVIRQHAVDTENIQPTCF